MTEPTFDGAEGEALGDEYEGSILLGLEREAEKKRRIEEWFRQRYQETGVLPTDEEIKASVKEKAGRGIRRMLGLAPGAKFGEGGKASLIPDPPKTLSTIVSWVTIGFTGFALWKLFRNWRKKKRKR